MAYGRKTAYDATFLTSKVVYRQDIGNPDIDVDTDANNADIPEIRLDVVSSVFRSNTGAGTDAVSEAAQRAYNGRLLLYTKFAINASESSSGESLASPTATLKVYVWGGPSELDPNYAGSWCFVDEFNVTEDSLIRVIDIPMGVYKVTVSDITDGYSISIVEQHTE